MCSSPTYIHLRLAGFRDNAGFKETSFFGDEGRHRKPVLPGEVSEIGDGMPQHLVRSVHTACVGLCGICY